MMPQKNTLTRFATYSFFILLCLVGGATAVTWNLTDSVTGIEGQAINGPTYNSGGYFTYDGINDYFNTSVAVNYSTSFSFSAYVRNTNGTVCGDGAAPFGRAYDWRLFTGSSCEIIVNVQNATNQDNTHYNASLVFTNNVWRHVVWTYDSSLNRSVVYVDGILRSNITQRGIDQISASIPWRMGGNPTTALYFNGSVANVTVWNTTLNQANVTYLQGNNTPYCTNLRNWWAFASTNVSCLSGGGGGPTYDTYVNISISNTALRTIPPNFRGLDTHPIAGFPYYESNGSLRNNSLDLAVINSFDPSAIRDIIDLPNQCTSYSGNPTNPCTFPTTNTSNYQNINLHRSILGNASLQGRKYYVNIDGMPKWLANNASNCNYGATDGATYFYYTSCNPSNPTIFANAVAQYMEALGCTTTYQDVCVLEHWNEAYLIPGGGSGAGAGVFYLKNSTVDCAARTSSLMTLYNQTAPIYMSRLGSSVEYLSPSFNYGYSSCGISMSNQFMAEHAPGGNASPDYMNTHEYSSSNPPALTTDLATAQAAFTAGGWGDKWKITEGNLNNDALNTNSPEVTLAYLMQSMIYLIQNTSGQGWVLYDYDTDETYSTYNYPNQLSTPNFLKATGLMLNATKAIGDDGGTAYPCTVTGDSDVTCAYILKNNTLGVLLVTNRQNNTLLIQNISITGANITAGFSNTNATTFTASSGKLTNVPLGKYGIDGYNLTIQGADILPPTITNRTEWTNSTALQVNITTDEPANVSFNYGTNASSLPSTGAWVNISSFGTAWAINVTGPLTSNTNYHYTIKVCDSLGNCYTSPIYSEYTKNGSVSFNTLTPATTTPSIAEPNNQTFSYTLTNPSGIVTTSTWRVNGTNITACYNLTSCTFVGNYSSAGIYAYNVSIVSSENNLSYQWTLTVNNTVSSISFNTLSPVGNPSIDQTSSQAFSYTLTNPDALTTLTTWRINGVNQTGCYNATSCNVVASVLGPGTYTVNATVVASTNTISNQWTLTVTSTDSCSNVPYGNIMVLLLIMCAVMFVWGIYDMLSSGSGFSMALLLAAIIGAVVVVSIMPGLAATVCVI